MLKVIGSSLVSGQQRLFTLSKICNGRHYKRELILRRLQVAEIVVHKEFDYAAQVNDIAVLKTGKSFKVIFHLKKSSI